MAKNTRKTDLAQVKKSLAILRKKGLYKPKQSRAKPTKYGLSLLRKYRDVTAGRSFVIKADKAALNKLSETYRTSRGKVVIPKVGMNTIPRITRAGEVVHRLNISGKTYRYRPAHMIDGTWPELGPFQSYTVQIKHGREHRQLAVGSAQELMQLINEYGDKNGRGFDITPYVRIAEPEGLKKVRVHFVRDGARAKSRVVRVANIEQATDEFRYRFPEFADWIITRIEPLG